jgi:20S proteasome alpha/beta subunit
MHVAESESIANQRLQRGRWVYIPGPEETPVTFQVGIVGSDGVVLASDLCHIYPGNCADSRTAMKSKIMISKDQRIACCASGDDTAAYAAQLCAGSRDDLEIRQFLMDCSEAAIKRDAAGTSNHGAVLAVDRSPNGAKLYQLILRDPVLIPYEISYGAVYQGDQGNPAAFFLERYVPKMRNVPLEQLILVAAHAVVTAGSINPWGVRGLEIVICTKDGFQLLADQELSKLVDQSRTLDSAIADSLGIPPV